jgi:hypothetical protein
LELSVLTRPATNGEVACVFVVAIVNTILKGGFEPRADAADEDGIAHQIERLGLLNLVRHARSPLPLPALSSPVTATANVNRAKRLAESARDEVRWSLDVLQSAHRSFVLQCSNNRPGFRAHDPVNSKIKPLLKLLNCGLGLRAEVSVNAPCVEANCTHATLKTAHWQASRAKPENGLALVRFIDVDPRNPANDPVHCYALRLLKGPDRLLGASSENTIDRSWIVSQHLQGILQVPHSRIG